MNSDSLLSEGTTSHFETSDGFGLFCRHWEPQNRSGAAIVCLHGTGENSEFFQPIGYDLSKAGYDVYAIDLRGFGLSVEHGLKRGDTRSFKRQLQDLVEFVEFIGKGHKSECTVLLGHSHGCAYALWFAAHYGQSIGGLVLAAPPVTVSSSSRVPGRQYLKFVLALLFAPKTMYSFEGEGMEEGRIEQHVSKSSPIARSVSIRWLYGSKELLLDPMFKHAASIRVPTLILNGTADTVSLPAGAKILHDEIGSKDKTVELFKGADHFLYYEFMPASDREDHTDGKIVVDTVVKWLGERIPCKQ